MAQWLAYLAAERRMSPKTVEAYERDLRQFLGFLSGHLDGRVTLSALARLAPLDVRAFLAARRADGIGSRSLMRMLAGVRSFARFLERNGKGKVGALAAVRTPKIGKTLPKPLAIAAAKRMADTDLRAGEERDPWILARDAAVLALLYGSGLRISEALGLKRGDIPAPGRGDVITVTGKGNKARMVPVLAKGRRARGGLHRALPASAAGRRSLVRGRQRRPALAAHHPAGDGAPARSARPARKRYTARAAPFLRNAPAGARR
jgi:integrase/recombinase XerC